MVLILSKPLIIVKHYIILSIYHIRGLPICPTGHEVYCMCVCNFVLLSYISTLYHLYWLITF